jgi:hypothetical protein
MLSRRIAAVAGVCAAAVVAGCGTSSSSPSTTRPVATPTATTKPSLESQPSPSLSQRTVPSDLVGERLDVAETELDQSGIGYTAVGGGTFGIVVKSDWVVCQTKPSGGQPVLGTVDLIVDHFSCSST